MNDNYSFRSAFRGFNRNDVMNYIAGMMEDVSSHENRIAELQKKLAEKEAAFNELSERYLQLKAERVEKIEKKAEQEKKCEDCDINRQTEARLGAAMMDARRFSDLLIQEANDKTLDIYKNAFETVNGSKSDAQALADQIASASDTFSSILGDLQNKIMAIIGNMEQFSKSIEDKGAKFEYNSDFTDNVVEYRKRGTTDNRTESSIFYGEPPKNNGNY